MHTCAKSKTLEARTAFKLGLLPRCISSLHEQVCARLSSTIAANALVLFAATVVLAVPLARPPCQLVNKNTPLLSPISSGLTRHSCGDASLSQYNALKALNGMTCWWSAGNQEQVSLCTTVWHAGLP